MDVESFFTELYVSVDDCYKAQIAAKVKKHEGARAKLSDSEVLTIAIAGQWRQGVPWTSERSVVRWVKAHGQARFPNMIERGGCGEHSLRCSKSWASG